MSKQFQPSEFQQAYFDWIKKGSGSAIMKAVAGSGKTTTIVHGMNYIPDDAGVLFLAFNKAIAEELASRVPDHVTCKTMNALGHGAVTKKFGRNIKLDANKTSLVLDVMMKDKVIVFEDVREHGQIIKRLVAIAKQVGLVPKSCPDKVSLVEDTDENWDMLIDHYDIDFGSEDRAERIKDQVIEWVRIALTISINTTSTIDFNDQLYLPVVYGLTIPKYDWVIVDEAQDISAIQRCLLQKALEKNGRLVAVGDPAQAIYGFRGADSKSLENISKTFNCTELPLTISYRCPKAVIREAQQYVSHITSADSAMEGSVTDMGVAKPEMFRPGDMAICRNTAPIIQLAYSLISKRIPAKVMGREIGEGLVTLIRKLKSTSIPVLEKKLETWKDRECQRIRLKDGADADLSKIEDKHDCIKCFLEFAAPESVEGLIRSIQSMFDESSVNAVTLSTIHKAKGLEAKRVFIVDRWRMPSKWAKKAHQVEQEINLIYVAITRAQEELIYVEMPKKKED